VSLFDPLDENDPEAWALRFLSHFALGLFAWHSLIWVMPPVHAAWVVPAVYFVGWEALVQRLGAGLRDAAVDTWATALGAVTGLQLLLGPSLLGFVALFLIAAGSLFAGIWRRLL
jgi:hypothetical protein